MGSRGNNNKNVKGPSDSGKYAASGLEGASSAGALMNVVRKERGSGGNHETNVKGPSNFKQLGVVWPSKPTILLERDIKIIPKPWILLERGINFHIFMILMPFSTRITT